MAKKKKQQGGPGGKKKKGKKTSRPSDKLDKHKAALKLAGESAKIWQLRVEESELAKAQYRKMAESWLSKNQVLQSQVAQVERDTIDVITFLKRKDMEKDRKIELMERDLNNIQARHKEEVDLMVTGYNQRIHELEEALNGKNRELEWIHSEMKAVKEFRREKTRMQKDLEEIKEALLMAETEYKRSMARMEQKFVEEKVRLQSEANRKVAELAEKAHEEAVTSLNEAARSVFRENVRLNAALTIHRNKEQKLSTEKKDLTETATLLQGELETATALLEQQESIESKQKRRIEELENKVAVLEAGLLRMANEFETDRKELIERSRLQSESTKNELTKVEAFLDLKTRELVRIKKLARQVLEQRTDVERFLLDSMALVRSEIEAQRRQYKHDAQVAYEQRMSLAFAGRAPFPPVRTFKPSNTSTNNVFSDFAAAETLKQRLAAFEEWELSVKSKNSAVDFKLAESGQPVDISELSWEQREKVIRYLFARMNRVTSNGSTKSTKDDQASQLSSALDSPHSSEDSETSDTKKASKKGRSPKLPKPLLPALVSPPKSNLRQSATSSAGSEHPDAKSVFITQGSDDERPTLPPISKTPPSILPQQVEAAS